jgi:membrane-associated phospholipid phosphatase
VAPDETIDSTPHTTEPVPATTWHEQLRNVVLHPSRSTLIRAGIATLIVVAAVFIDRQFLGWGLFATLAILFVPVGRARFAVAAFVPYASVWFIFTFLRSLADETRLAKTVNTKASEIERWIFNGELPTIRLQAEFYDPSNIAWYDYYLTFVHWSYFLIPHAVAIFLWWKYPSRFLQYLRAMTLLLVLGLVLYFAMPSNPPWMAPESVNTPSAATALRIMEPIAIAIGGGLYQAGYKIVGESNPIAAMPSIHMAITFLLVPVSYYFGRVWQVLAWVYAFSMGLALVYLGEHYVIDVVVGSVIAAYSWRAARGWMMEVFPMFVRFVTQRIGIRRRPTAGQPANTRA